MLSLEGFTDTETADLLAAMRANCACELREGVVVGQCAPCRMLDTDERAVHGLLFMRRYRASIIREEQLLAVI